LLKARLSPGSKNGFFAPERKTSMSTCSATLTGHPSKRTTCSPLAARSFIITLAILAKMSSWAMVCGSLVSRGL
jgi:hypothetical protein